MFDGGKGLTISKINKQVPQVVPDVKNTCCEISGKAAQLHSEH